MQNKMFKHLATDVTDRRTLKETNHLEYSKFLFWGQIYHNRLRLIHKKQINILTEVDQKLGSCVDFIEVKFLREIEDLFDPEAVLEK